MININIYSFVFISFNLSSSTGVHSTTDEYDKHPNEVVKNEELTYNSSSGRVWSSTTITSSTTSILAFTLLLLVLVKQYNNLFNFSNSWCQRWNAA